MKKHGYQKTTTKLSVCLDVKKVTVSAFSKLEHIVRINQKY